MKRNHPWRMATNGMIVAGAVAFACVSGAGAGEVPVRDAGLDALLTQEAQRYIDRFPRLREQARNIEVTVRADLASRRIVVDLGAGALPDEDDGRIERFEQELGGIVDYFAREAGLTEPEGIRILYEGKEFKDYFPYEGEEQVRHRMEPRAAAGLVVVSASHGLYRHHPGLDWRFQRPLINSIREDEITPAYGDMLESLLEERSEMTVRRARSRESSDHDEAAQPWWKMSSRYHLKALYPEEPGIWHSLPNSTDGDREIKEDIRARPKYANFIKADGLISLHTNGSDNGSVRGAEVYYHQDKPEDRALADNMLCYMKEIVLAQQGYEAFPFRGPAKAGRHGENRIGVMPSVIVEVAYHSNTEDALALQDPAFRTAAMKGVEKGYRLWREGKACIPLALQRVTDITLPPHTVGDVEVHFEGHPRFPVTMEITLLDCPQGSTCDGGQEVRRKPQDSPLTFEIECGRGDHTRTSLWQTVLRDDDGVASKPVKHRLTCTGPAAASHGRTQARGGRHAGRIGMW